ncbi:malonyl CoA-acyl carrier protein transacylase [Aspergillus sclerotioniger CBS 115572]|uniref:[acyl-carrier-protein] S-malonyltransferase n=1 Tax=Aspergillus sclerotioniger CBS 115572 TaxID=1450535 RepID=A0A317X5F4_9EURO|nr:malonyl CoA-acyl carrier protein transacylase [Aspergillus sclerotioniger CBS 115572]PWY93844.1 malonyl CoA-acyl carrier protein transacylase [Aspergillus sclerotioniger CBS 115572]
MLAFHSRSRLVFDIKTLRHHVHRPRQLNVSLRRKYATAIAAETILRTALFFPGHGVQRVGMASSWVNKFPKTSGKFLDEMDSILGFKLSQILSEGPNAELNKTENSQPAIMATSILILRILEEEFGFETKSRINVTLGHSLGEFSALAAGSYLDFGDALKLVRRRAEIMSQCTRDATESSGEDYGMIALICEPDRLSELIATIHEFIGRGPSNLNDDSNYGFQAFQQVMVANVNSRDQIVLSGSLPRIKALLIQLRQFGGHDPRAVKLRCESPFHSSIMLPAANYMKQALEHMNINFPAQIPCISNVSGLPFNSKEELKVLLSQQCVETVKWWDSIRYLGQVQGVRRWIGIGPGKVGRNLVGKEVGNVTANGGGVWSICDPLEVENILIAFEKTKSDALHD